MSSSLLRYAVTLVALTTAAAVMSLWLVRETSAGISVGPPSSAAHAAKPAAPTLPPVRLTPEGKNYRAVVAGLRAQGWSEADIRRHLTAELAAHFQCEQYRAELAFGQLRYPEKYWEPAPEVEALYALETARLAELRKLDRELHGVLHELFGAEAEPVSPRRSLFGLDAPAPKLDFLSPAAREALVREMMTRDPDAALSSFDRMALAERVLSPEEFALFGKWNSPAATALRAQLVEFRPDAAEFDAIYDWHRLAGSEQGFPDEDAKQESLAQLKAALGPERAAAFERTEDPVYQTAVQDLRQLGLPLQRVNDMVRLRRQTAEAIDALWRDSAVPEAGRAAAVEAVRQSYRQQLAEVLRVPLALIPESL